MNVHEIGSTSEHRDSLRALIFCDDFFLRSSGLGSAANNATIRAQLQTLGAAGFSINSSWVVFGKSGEYWPFLQKKTVFLYARGSLGLPRNKGTGTHTLSEYLDHLLAIYKQSQVGRDQLSVTACNSDDRHNNNNSAYSLNNNFGERPIRVEDEAPHKKQKRTSSASISKSNSNANFKPLECFGQVPDAFSFFKMPLPVPTAKSESIGTQIVMNCTLEGLRHYAAFVGEQPAAVNTFSAQQLINLELFIYADARYLLRLDGKILAHSPTLRLKPKQAISNENEERAHNPCEDSLLITSKYDSEEVLSQLLPYLNGI